MTTKYVDIVFDGPPAPESGRFIEVEDEAGASIALGEWIEREDGYWVLRIESRACILEEAASTIPSFPEPENPFTYDPWDDDSIDPTNLDEVVRVAVVRGWSMGAYRAREEAARTIRALAASWDMDA